MKCLLIVCFLSSAAYAGFKIQGSGVVNATKNLINEVNDSAPVSAVKTACKKVNDSTIASVIKLVIAARLAQFSFESVYDNLQEYDGKKKYFIKLGLEVVGVTSVGWKLTKYAWSHGKKVFIRCKEVVNKG